jgi:hypothetical protein
MYNLCATPEPLALLAAWSLISLCAAAFVTCNTIAHRSFPLKQDGGVPASTNAPTRTHIVRPPNTRSRPNLTWIRYFTLASFRFLPASPNHQSAPTSDSSATPRCSCRGQHCQIPCDRQRDVAKHPQPYHGTLDGHARDQCRRHGSGRQGPRV